MRGFPCASSRKMLPKVPCLIAPHAHRNVSRYGISLDFQPFTETQENAVTRLGGFESLPVRHIL